ncbi:hypothetical protein [uncultured Gimesia sp.]|uniref:hypothetical protein n=1 Tax=uncultured Gimesia sp. TaxID=1678688 RepID=UPI0030D7833C|tara:strand:+ start:94630 stop:95085 length:456 start_codon:yes stop_codon:yes gene_type:complete
MSLWIDNEVVNKAQKNGDFSAIIESGVQFCMSPDRKYCILVRDHSAWHVEGEGWRDSNDPPENEESGRQMLNFFKCQIDSEIGIWFKAFIPQDEAIRDIESVDDECCEVIIGSERHRIYYTKIDGLMWDLMTGNAVTEDEIKTTFSKIWNT